MRKIHDDMPLALNCRPHGVLEHRRGPHINFSVHVDDKRVLQVLGLNPDWLSLDRFRHMNLQWSEPEFEQTRPRRMCHTPSARPANFRAVFASREPTND